MLTPDEREFAFGVLRSHWIVARIRSAATDEDAIAEVKSWFGQWGMSGPGTPSLTGTARGIDVFSARTPDGERHLSGLITWREIVDTVRRPQPAQMTLF